MSLSNKPPGSLSFEEIIVACRNIGVNLECGGCASVFFTGFGGDPHDENCTRRSSVLTAVKVDVTEALQAVESKFVDMLSSLGSCYLDIVFDSDPFAQGAQAPDISDIPYYNEACAKCGIPRDLHLGPDDPPRSSLHTTYGDRDKCRSFRRCNPPRAAYGTLKSDFGGRFVEVESRAGTGIKVGEWINRGDGYWALRLTLADFLTSKPECTPEHGCGTEAKS